MSFTTCSRGLTIIVWIMCLFPGAPHANPSEEAPHWFIDWGGKTQRIFNTTTGLPGIRAGMIREPYAFGGAAYTLTDSPSEGDALRNQRQVSYTLGGAYAEYRYAFARWMTLMPNIFLGYGTGTLERRNVDVFDQTWTGGYVIEPALNLGMEFMHRRYLNIGGGYSIVNQANGFNNGAIFNIAFRMEW